MGISCDGGMLVGNSADELNIPEHEDGPGEWCYEQGLSEYSPWFDAGFEESYVGIPIDNIAVKDIDETWIAQLKEKAQKFKEITGAEAMLIGMQNIT